MVETPTSTGIVVDENGVRVRTANAHSLQDLQEAVGGYIEYAPLSDQYNLGVLVNEEGLVLDLPVNSTAARFGHWYAGPIVIVNADTDADGATLPLTDEQLRHIDKVLGTAEVSR